MGKSLIVGVRVKILGPGDQDYMKTPCVGKVGRIVERCVHDEHAPCWRVKLDPCNLVETFYPDELRAIGAAGE